jgi:hypothetical protein
MIFLIRSPYGNPSSGFWVNGENGGFRPAGNCLVAIEYQLRRAQKVLQK